MTELTTKEIAAQLQRSDLAATIYQEAVRSIAARRRIIKERLSSIEDRNGVARRAAIESADSEVLAKLNRECEALDDELQMNPANVEAARRLAEIEAAIAELRSALRE